MARHAVVLVAALVLAACTGARAFVFTAEALANGTANSTAAWINAIPPKCTVTCGVTAPCNLRQQVAELREGDVLCINPLVHRQGTDVTTLGFPPTQIRFANGSVGIDYDPPSNGPWLLRQNWGEYMADRARHETFTLSADEIPAAPPVGVQGNLFLHQVPPLVVRVPNVVIQSLHEDMPASISADPLQTVDPEALRSGLAYDSNANTSIGVSTNGQFSRCSVFVVQAANVTFRRLSLFGSTCVDKTAAVDSALVAFTTPKVTEPGIYNRRFVMYGVALVGGGGGIITRADRPLVSAIDIEGSVMQAVYIQNGTYCMFFAETSGTLYLDMKNSVLQVADTPRSIAHVFVRAAEQPKAGTVTILATNPKGGLSAIGDQITQKIIVQDVAAVNAIPRTGIAFNNTGTGVAKAAVMAAYPELFGEAYDTHRETATRAQQACPAQEPVSSTHSAWKDAALASFAVNGAMAVVVGVAFVVYKEHNAEIRRMKKRAKTTKARSSPRPKPPAAGARTASRGVRRRTRR